MHPSRIPSNLARFQLQQIPLRWVKTGSESIIRDTEVYKEIATIRGSGTQFTEIEWLPRVSFLALLALLSLLVITVLLCVTDSSELYKSVSQKSQTWDQGLCASGTEDKRKLRTVQWPTLRRRCSRRCGTLNNLESNTVRKQHLSCILHSLGGKTVCLTSEERES